MKYWKITTLVFAVLVLIGATIIPIQPALKLSTALYTDLINEYTTDAGVTIDGVLLKDGVIATGGIEGTSVLSTGEGGGTKYLREDGDGTSSWQTVDASPLTTKGDIYVYSTGNARLPVGTDGQFVVADSTEATGLKWVDFELARDATPQLAGNLLADGADITGAGLFSGATLNLTANSNQIVLDSDDGGGITTTITDSATSARTLTLPDDTGTLITSGSTATLTSKTIDADSNTITNIGSTEVKSEMITGQTNITDVDVADTILISDNSDSNNLKEISLADARQVDNNDQTGTTYTFVLGDAGKTIYSSNVSAQTISIPLESSVNFPINTTIAVVQENTGVTTITAVSGVTLNGVDNGSAVISNQYGTVLLEKRGADAWFAYGEAWTDIVCDNLTIADGGNIGSATVTDAITIDSSGNVGIGTSSPNKELHINTADSGEAVSQYTNSTTGTTASDGFVIGLGSDEAVYLNQQEADSMVLLTSGSTRMTIASGGTVNVVGELTAGTKTFKIDHPLDPENKFLQHSVIESPEMRNTYFGQVSLDGFGKATVTMPDYWHTLNGTDKAEFNYQLTSIGGKNELWISKELENGTFEIEGINPNMKVSWQVSAIRHDPYAEEHRIQVETDKVVATPTEETKEVEEADGTYLETYDVINSVDAKGFYLQETATRKNPPKKTLKSKVKIKDKVTALEGN